MKRVVSAVTEFAVGLAFVAAYVFLFRYLHSFGPRQEASLIWIKFLPPAILTLVGWYRYGKLRTNLASAGWRKAASVVALLAETLSISVPWLVAHYDLRVVGFDMRRYPTSKFPGWKVIDLYLTFRTCSILGLLTMALGFAAPKRIRLAVVLGGFAMYLLMDTLAVK
ncbi:MAG: hypothetical protein WCD47_19840 [Candidatus Sulfotelmatobacter sp.]